MEGIYIVANSEQTLKKKTIGVYKKIIAQLTVFKEEDLNVHLYTYEPKTGLFNKIARRLPFNLFIPDIQYQDDFSKLDFIYIRKMMLNYPIYNFLKKVRKNNPKCKILLEIPTYPYEYEGNKSIFNSPFYIKDKHYRNKLSGYVDKIVTYSNDNEIFGISTINISNGIKTQDIVVRNYTEKDHVGIIAVASFDFWHGYDRFIKGLGEYYKNGGKEKIILHIVGEGRVVDQYKVIAQEYNILNNVVFHGKKFGRELDYIYDKCDLGLDAMGRHRSGVYYNSSLKGKEYAAKGLPIISGVKTELDDSNDFNYYMRVPADDSDIDIIQIIDFYNKIYENNNPNKIINDIRKYAEENFEMKICMKPITEYIKN